MLRDCDLTQRREGGSVSLDATRVPRAPDAASRIPGPGGAQAIPGGPVLIRQPRADLTTINASTTGAPQSILPANERRCYFLVQNTGVLPIRVGFGVDAGANTGLLLNPGATYEAPVAPANSVSIFGPVGATFALLYANDQR